MKSLIISGNYEKVSMKGISCYEIMGLLQKRYAQNKDPVNCSRSALLALGAVLALTH